MKETVATPKKVTLEPKTSSSSGSGSRATETTPLVPKNAPQGGDDGDPAVPNVAPGGLSVAQAFMLVGGATAGAGILALPRAIVRTGWAGIPILVLIGFLAAFCGKQLSECWSIIEQRDPEMRGRKRNPYAIIVERALGKVCSVVASMAVMVTLFGASVVFLLMASQIVQELLLSLVTSVTYCIWILIVAGAMTPLMLFGTPRDFSYLGIISFFSVAIASVLYFIQMLSETRPFPFRVGIHGFQEFFLALGVMMFAFGGTSSFPTIQNDMADKSKFGSTLKYSFLAMTIMYLVITITAYLVYGESIPSNFAISLTTTPLTLVANVLMVVHLISAFITLINPVCQEMEELYEVSRDSIPGRIGVRVSIMLAIIFIGESIPRFQSIVSLVGGSTVALLTFVLPPLCYIKLAGQTPKEGQMPIAQPTWMKILGWSSIFLGVVGGVIAAISAMSAIFGSTMTTPCYMR